MNPSIRAYRLRRWALFNAIVAFLALISVLTNIDPRWWIPVIIVIEIVFTPNFGSEKPMGLVRGLLAALAALGLYVIVSAGLLWMIALFHLNMGVVFAETFLAIAIAQLAWAEIIWHPGPGVPPEEARQWNDLIDRIRRL